MIQVKNLGQLNHMWNPNEDAGFMAILKTKVMAVARKIADFLRAA
jgi:hypothetical protein